MPSVSAREIPLKLAVDGDKEARLPFRFGENEPTVPGLGTAKDVSLYACADVSLESRVYPTEDTVVLDSTPRIVEEIEALDLLGFVEACLTTA